MGSSFVHASAIVEDNVVLEADSKVWHFCHVRSGAILEEGVTIGKDVYIDCNVRIGKFTRIQNGVSVYQGVNVSPWCFIGPHVIFTNDISPRSGSKNWEITPTFLKTGMSIGAGSVIRCGITLGEFCMIGAGAIVTKDVPPFHLAMGFTAEIKKMVCACGKTFLELNSSPAELVRRCCRENLQPQALKAATDYLGL